MFQLGRGFYVMGFVAALGCGGQSTTIIYVIADGGATAPVTIDASSGDGGSSSSGKPPTLAEACQALCDRLAKANCVRADCAASCQRGVGNASCTDAYVKFL